MSQEVAFWIDDRKVHRTLPDADDCVMPGIRWGQPETLFTPAYWVSQLWMSQLDQAPASAYQAQSGLVHEVTFCLLGGFGIKAELATAAFNACISAGLLEDQASSPDLWAAVLSQPVVVDGRVVRYRYPNQKARYLAGAMAHLQRGGFDLVDGRALRDRLLEIPGIGPKTAGWIARNLLDSDEVAILDIHIVRAGLLCDLFSPNQKVEREYFQMESRYIEFCRAMGVRPAILDCLIWDQMRTLGAVPIEALKRKLGQVDVRSYPVQAQLPFAH